MLSLLKLLEGVQDVFGGIGWFEVDLTGLCGNLEQAFYVLKHSVDELFCHQ